MSTAEPTKNLVGVARDAETITEVLAEFAADGFDGQFVQLEDEPGNLMCAACKTTSHARAFGSNQLRRLEGASDPDDMLAIAAVVCPSCGARGTLVLNYGPMGGTADDAILRELGAEPARVIV